MDSETTHEVQTGTLDFLACKVEAQQYLFEVPRDLLDKGSNSNDHRPLPFKFDPLHDVESIWWIPTWILARLSGFTGSSPDGPVHYHLVLLRACVSSLRWLTLPAKARCCQPIPMYPKSSIPFLPNILHLLLSNLQPSLSSGRALSDTTVIRPSTPEIRSNPRCEALAVHYPNTSC